MDNIKDVLKGTISESGLVFNQDFIDNINKGLYEEATLPENKSFYQNQLNGGQCYYCKKDWIKKEKKNQVSNYSQFYPQCTCYEDKQKNKELKEMQKTLCLWSGIPKKYISKEVENLDLKKITSDTVEAVEKTKNYIDLKLYNKNFGILFHGDIGAGKTLLAVLIFKHLILHENKSGRFIRMSDILDSIIKSDYTFIENLMRYDVVLLDDLDKLKAAKGTAKSGWASERIFSLFDNLINNRKIIISTTNCQKVSELNDFFDSSVVSRLVGNSDIVKVKGNDYRIIERELLIKGDKID